MSQAKEIREEAAAEKAYQKAMVAEKPAELEKRELLRQGLVDLEQVVVDMQLGPDGSRRLHEAISALRALV